MRAQIPGELPERDDSRPALRVRHDVAEVGERVVLLRVPAAPGAQITGPRQAFGVRLPGAPFRLERVGEARRTDDAGRAIRPDALRRARDQGKVVRQAG